jgi:glycosyltransferase involved in cell wall biosynthesis
VLSDQPWAASRLKRIYNGIAPLPAPCGTRADIRVALGVPSDRPLIGMLGRVSAWKGQEIFLRAAARVRISHPACHFVAIGGVFDGDVERWEALFSLRRNLGLEDAVSLCGFRKDARELLSAMDIFVLPSTAPDPFPTVILEAMSAALPVIATAHGGPLEMVLNGRTGLLVPPSDPTALAAAIKRLLDNPALGRAMGASGRTRMLQHFERSRYLEQVQLLYEQVLRKQDAAEPGALPSTQRCSSH